MSASDPVIIVGGGPAGMVAGFLLARAGVRVTVLEKHADFLRDFRGDTVHPSTLELFNEIGLLGPLLAEPHAKLDTMTLNLLGRRYTLATLKHLRVAAPFVAMMPQWDFLDFIARHAKRYACFDLRMSTEATGLMHDAHGRVSGVRLANGELLSGRLVIAADGRWSVLRASADLPLDDLGAPMDILWFRVPAPAGGDMTEVALGTIDRSGIIVAIPRGDYWQCARVIEKGGLGGIKGRGIGAFRANVAPIGGVGINLAVQDAVAAANILAKPLAAGSDPDPLLPRVQARRWTPTVRMQALQRFAHQRVIEPMLRGEIIRVPLAVRLLDAIPLLRRIPGRVLGLGFGRQHVESPLAKDFS